MKNAHYRVDVKFIYNTYWDGVVKGRHSMIVTNIRKQQGATYLEPQKCDIKQDQVKIIPMEWQTFSNSKTDTSELKQFIDKTFNIDCYIDIRFRVTKSLLYDGFFFSVKLPQSCHKVAMTISNCYQLNYDKQLHSLNIFTNTSYKVERQKYENF